MEKVFLKMNNNDKYLSIGNLFRIIKLYSVNKKLVGQADLFCILFGLDDVSESTVNNYCIGARRIADDYKDVYIKYQHDFLNNKFCLADVVGRIVSVLNGNLVDNNDSHYINGNHKFKNVCLALYNICKNDRAIDDDFCNDVQKLIDDGLLYDCFCKFLFFIVLDHVQPIYVDDVIREDINNILYNTNISIDSLEEFLVVNFNDGLNDNYSLQLLASKGNPCALFELGLMEYNGQFTGSVRYNKAYQYFNLAAVHGHPRANYMVGMMLVNGIVGSKCEDDIRLGLDFLNKAVSLGSVAALNSLGKYYLSINDIEKAIFYFNLGIKKNHAFSYNNLGRIHENKNEFDLAFKYYIESAKLQESWACNKVGEFYRLGLGVVKDLKKAFYYYNKAIDVPIKYVCNYAKYNLATFFYLNGNYLANVEKDEDMAIKLYKESSCVIDSSMFLVCYFAKKYLITRDKLFLGEFNKYVFLVESNIKYDEFYKEKIECELCRIKSNYHINFDL